MAVAITKLKVAVATFKAKALAVGLVAASKAAAGFVFTQVFEYFKRIAAKY